MVAAKTLPTPDIWPQRARFRELLEDWTSTMGKTQEDFAREVGISLPHLRNCLYRANRRLSIRALTRAAILMGVRITELIEDPGEKVHGAAPEATEVQRFALRLIGRDVQGMTEEQLATALEAWKATMRALGQPV